ncbi:hypothetical protein TRFO_18930 [Tritrichomonas foetus]|uniref:Initiator binding domain-containing protein n=1 Tax=Tritrichomonas foetus TaxID=1144522 RepID=A0A1J4KKB6_9EUKA|nr:hypothetical protein TRFO_18930 [Tritrichomonas foetus]|eukprot:OHT11570.1 hypothetical protein TRFO_18930 [Tritrichomonas foetus]
MDFWDECSVLDEFLTELKLDDVITSPKKRLNFLTKPKVKDFNILDHYIFSSSTIELSPKQLSFIPKSIWTSQNKVLTLDRIIATFFHARSSAKVRFEHKLWNALQITKNHPTLFSIIGVCWISNTIIKVHKLTFGKFLALKKITSALFTSKGSFPSHGFIEISDLQLKSFHLNENDILECRFYTHKDQKFTILSTEEEISKCHWISSSV